MRRLTVFAPFSRVILLVCAWWLSGAVSAAAIPPDQLVKDLFDTSIARVKADEAIIAKDRTHLITLAEELVVPYVSFEKMSKQILGKHWRTITPDQQKRFTTAFKSRISTLLVEKYDPKKQWALKITGSRTGNQGRIALVSSEVTDISAARKYAISYRFFLDPKANRWMVFDVIVEGISVLTSFQTASSEEIRKGGIEQLIKQLETGQLKTEDPMK